ncbi:unnamed protein product [Adineta steineri]|uniref:Uncharacterized protein n=1 Tax=Adineta steineri TaxID=433720 RepID=A0A818ZUL5_9BILA|nr:unnamed protein product [Adineta steineri]CAF0968371.1 unnamed protein product [Adineta steineri]CAF3625929.1 unnamed protein product [Adineta steineri]CAF3777163.1 unnamed protein product [Adineta steineri]
MRLIGSEEHEQVWRSKIWTLGPFALLLWDNPIDTKMKTKMRLYRAVNLSEEQLDVYRDMAIYPHKCRSFQAFTSCTRKIEVAEFYNMNTIFTMDILLAFTTDLSLWSPFGEEEELITPGVCFKVQRMGIDHPHKDELQTSNNSNKTTEKHGHQVMYRGDGDSQQIIYRDDGDDPYSGAAGRRPDDFRFGPFTPPFLDFPDSPFDFSFFRYDRDGNWVED